MRMEAAALPPFAVMAAEIWPKPLAVASALRKIASASPDVQQAALLTHTECSLMYMNGVSFMLIGRPSTGPPAEIHYGCSMQSEAAMLKHYFQPDWPCSCCNLLHMACVALPGCAALCTRYKLR